MENNRLMYRITSYNVCYTKLLREQFNQKMANKLSLSGNLIILCGHFKGIDYRIREHLVTKEISIGDYVLTGGELAAAVIADAIIRIIPGVISDEQSALSDSFHIFGIDAGTDVFSFTRFSEDFSLRLGNCIVTDINSLEANRLSRNNFV